MIKIKKNEMGGTCVVHGGESRRINGFGGRNPRARDHMGDSGVNRRIILKWTFRKWDVVLWTVWSWLKRGAGGGYL